MNRRLRTIGWTLLAALIGVVALVASVACGLGAFHGAQPFPSGPVQPVPVVTHHVACVVGDQDGRPVEGATCAIGAASGTTNGDGYRLLLHIPACGGPDCLGLHVTKDGYDAADVRFTNDGDLSIGVTLHRRSGGFVW